MTPTASVYTPRGLSTTLDTTSNSGSGDGSKGSNGGSGDVVATAVAALMAATSGNTTTNPSITNTTTTTTNSTTIDSPSDTASIITHITHSTGSVHQLDSTTLSTANASGQNMYGTSGAALTVGVPLSAKHGQARGNGGWVAVLKLTVSIPKVANVGNKGDKVDDGVEEQHFSLGRFDKEADAHLALQQAYLEVQENGTFRPRYYMKRLTAALIAAHPAPVAVVPKPLQPMQHGAVGLNKSISGYGGLNNNNLSNTAPNKYLASLQQSRNAHSSAMLGNNPLGANTNNSNNNVSVGETACGFNNVAKVVMALAPVAGGHGVHGSSSSGNISNMGGYQKK